MRRRPLTDDRALTSVVANVMMVAIAIVIAMTLLVFAFSYVDETPEATAEASFDIDPSPAGVTVTPTALGTDVEVLLDGERVATFAADDAGESTLVPTSRGDEILIVSREGDSSVLLRETVDDRSEAGDFVAHYTFEAGSGSTLVDRSGNGNDGTLQGDPTWIDDGQGAGLQFDGNDDYATVSDLGVDAVSVDEFTVAVAYRQAGSTGRVNQLVEHYFGGNEWYLETDAGSGSSSVVDYAVNYPTDVVTTREEYDTGDTHVAVGTYDGSEYELFVDGEAVGSGTYEDDVEMGDMVVAADAPAGSSQRLDGSIYEIRLYYTAFDDDSVRTITDVMD